jgi:hypothetical protein
MLASVQARHHELTEDSSSFITCLEGLRVCNFSEASVSVIALLFMQDFLSVKHKFKLEHQVFCMNLA